MEKLGCDWNAGIPFVFFSMDLVLLSFYPPVIYFLWARALPAMIIRLIFLEFERVRLAELPRITVIIEIVPVYINLHKY